MAKGVIVFEPSSILTLFASRLLNCASGSSIEHMKDPYVWEMACGLIGADLNDLITDPYIGIPGIALPVD